MNKREDFLELMKCFFHHQQALTFEERNQSLDHDLFNTMLSHDLNAAYRNLSSEERLSVAHCFA